MEGCSHSHYFLTGSTADTRIKLGVDGDGDGEGEGERIDVSLYNCKASEARILL